jgi:hypothetical protein
MAAVIFYMYCNFLLASMNFRVLTNYKNCSNNPLRSVEAAILTLKKTGDPVPLKILYKQDLCFCIDIVIAAVKSNTYN